MKTLLVLLVTVLAPVHVRLGPVPVPLSWLGLGLEAALTAAGMWLAVRVIRRSRPLCWPARISGGAP